MKIAHIIPTYNEKENIAKMIDIINSITERHSTWTSDIIVVDDYSPDGTSSIVKKLQKKYKNVFLLSKKKEGLGKALIKGYDYAVKTLHADVVIPNDADSSTKLFISSLDNSSKSFKFFKSLELSFHLSVD